MLVKIKKGGDNQGIVFEIQRRIPTGFKFIWIDFYKLSNFKIKFAMTKPYYDEYYDCNFGRCFLIYLGILAIEITS